MVADQDGRVRVYTSIAEIDPDEWSGVTEAAGAPVFYDYQFLRAYEQIPLQETETFFYLVFGEPAVAVLPACVQSTDDALGQLASLGLADRTPGDQILLTHVAHCYDTGLPARPGLLTPRLAAQACAAIAGLAGQAGLKWFAFLNVDGSAPVARALAAAGLGKVPMNSRFRRRLGDYPTVERLVTDLPGKKARRALRTSRHQALRAGMEVATAVPAGRAGEAVELCRRTTARHGTAGYYPERFGEFLALAADLVRVTEVRLRGRLASGAVCLRDRTRFHLWAGGIDYEVAAGIHSAFPLMLWPALEEAILLGHQVFEAGRGNAAAKVRFGLDPIPLFAFVGRP